jgi:protein-S-isoprenylcysteine O-methyltransferase Ste14
MFVNILVFVLGVIAPYAFEQFTYSQKISIQSSTITNTEGDVLQSYGWRIIWDIAYFIVVLAAGYRIIVLGALSLLSTGEWFGYCCFLSGIALRIWALTEIGGSYNSGIVIKQDHKIVQTGPYRVLRHPLHLGTFLQIAGLAAFSPYWLKWPIVFVSLILCLYLNRVEDRTHLQRLGLPYKSYYLKSWDIVDLIYWKSGLK